MSGKIGLVLVVAVFSLSEIVLFSNGSFSNVIVYRTTRTKCLTIHRLDPRLPREMCGWNYVDVLDVGKITLCG